MLTSAYTRPLVGEPYYRNIGLIKVVDRLNRSFSVGEIILERFDEQNFQYIIKFILNLIILSIKERINIKIQYNN